MKAAVLFELNQPLRVVDVEPAVIGAGQVLVNVEMAGICGAQLAEIRGEKGNARFLPHLMGHEGVGRVVEVGAGVSLTPGQRVVMHWRKGAGVECWDFPRYDLGGVEIQSGKVVTFTEQAICSENRLTPINEQVPDELAALMGCGISTALGAIENDAQLRAGESVLVIGCGGLGLNVIQAARLCGAGMIHAADISAAKAHVAQVVGAHEFHGGDAWPATCPRGFDVVVDTVGGEMLSVAMQFAGSGGRVVLIGQPKPGQNVLLPGASSLFDGDGKRIIASQGGAFMPQRDIPRMVRLWEHGRLSTLGIVSHTVTLDRINEGLDLVRSGQAGRVMVEI